MSYSRWGNSVWYTYHTTHSGETLETQNFVIWYVYSKEKTLSYTECLVYVADDIMSYFNCNELEAVELLEYISCFINNIEDRYA
jgi:hypothetical protein